MVHNVYYNILKQDKHSVYQNWSNKMIQMLQKIKVIKELGDVVFDGNIEQLALALNVKPHMLEHMFNAKVGLTQSIWNNTKELAGSNNIDVISFEKELDEKESKTFNQDYVLRVGSLISTLKKNSEVDSLVSPLHFTCVPTQRLVEQYLQYGDDLDHICFMIDGVWHADLFTGKNKDKDETFFRDAVVKMPDGTFNYDLKKHKELKSNMQNE